MCTTKPQASVPLRLKSRIPCEAAPLCLMLMPWPLGSGPLISIDCHKCVQFCQPISFICAVPCLDAPFFPLHLGKTLPSLTISFSTTCSGRAFLVISYRTWVLGLKSSSGPVYTCACCIEPESAVSHRMTVQGRSGLNFCYDNLLNCKVKCLQAEELFLKFCANLMYGLISSPASFPV